VPSLCTAGPSGLCGGYELVSDCALEWIRVDIAELAKRARDHVKEIFGITLEAEVNLIGIEI